MEIFYYLLVGGIAGWIASLLYKGSGSGLFMNILLGFVGGIVGGWVFQKLNIRPESGFIGSVITAAVGAFLVLWIYNLVIGKRR